MVEFTHKVLVPQRPGYIVSRPRLAQLLRTIAERRLITLTAPAGYGKTSLLIDFATSSPPLPICWYTLDSFDADPWTFLNYLAAAIDHRFPGATEQTRALLEGRSRTPFATASAALLREVYAIDQAFVVVLDDWHLVDHIPEIGETVARMLLHCPNCRFVLASRIYPGIPDLMLLAARRQMIGLDEERLRFTPEEVAAVLGAELQIDISPDQARALTEQSNGWITGILLSIQATDPTAPLRTPDAASAERQIYRFLAEQVLDHQSPALRAFLLGSSLLDELTPEHCDAMLGRNDSGQLLETLLRHHMFISEIRPGVLRYHPLFREFLQEQYRKADPQGYRQSALRIARAYVDQQQWSPAFDMCMLADDLEAARQVAAAGGEAIYTLGRLETLERWFAVLPLDALDAPLLCLRARVLLDRGRHHEAQALADLAEVRMRPDERALVLLLQSQLARLAGHYQQALDVGQQALTAAQSPAHRALALRTTAICHHRTGKTDVAIEELQEALQIERRRGDLYTVALLQYDLGICHEEAGLLREAERYYTQADAYWATIGNARLRALSLNSKGVLQHLTGRYRDAHATLTAALQHARDAAVSDEQGLILASLGDLYSDLQLWSQAVEAYQQSREIGGSAYLTSYLTIAEARLLVRQHQYQEAERVLARLPDTAVGQHRHALLILRGSIACGLGHYDAAVAAAQEAISGAERTGALIDLARAYLLLARVAADTQVGDSSRMLALLQRAADVVDQIGHDAFLVADALHMRYVLRHAATARWERADVWLQRQRELALTAQMIGKGDERPVLSVRTFGTDRIALNDAPVELGWLKAREVLYYLLIHPAGASPDELREAIWPALSPARSRGALKTAIYQLRSVLPRELIEMRGRQLYLIDQQVVRVDFDVDRFQQILDSHANDAEAIFEALDLYRGPFIPWSDNQWCRALRSYLDERYLKALRIGARACEQAHRYLDALDLYRRIIAADQFDEAAHAGVMRCQMALGNRAAAITQYQTLRRILDEELGLDPERDSEAERLYHKLLTAH